MKCLVFMTQIISIFALNLCRNCKYHSKGKCALFPIVGDSHETEYLDWTRARKNDYFCGEEGRYYEPLELPDYETYIQRL